MSYIVSTLLFSLSAGDSTSAQTVKGSSHALLGSELCSSTGCRRAPTVGSRDASVSIRPGVFRLDSVIHSVGSTDENIAPDGTTTLHNKRLLWKTTCERRELCVATSLQRFRLINCDQVGGGSERSGMNIMPQLELRIKVQNLKISHESQSATNVRHSIARSLWNWIITQQSPTRILR